MANAGARGILAVKVDWARNDREMEVIERTISALELFAFESPDAHIARCYGGFKLEPVSALGEIGRPVVTLMQAYAGTADQVLDRHEIHGQARANQVGVWVAQILHALVHIHTHHEPWLHLDVKPDNILVSATDGSVALTDFGSARPAAQAQAHKFGGGPGVFGTPFILPPETYNGAAVKQPGDIWALGITAATLLLGQSLVIQVVREHSDRSRVPGRMDAKALAQQVAPVFTSRADPASTIQAHLDKSGFHAVGPFVAQALTEAEAARPSAKALLESDATTKLHDGSAHAISQALHRHAAAVGAARDLVEKHGAPSTPRPTSAQILGQIRELDSAHQQYQTAIEHAHDASRVAGRWNDSTVWQYVMYHGSYLRTQLHSLDARGYQMRAHVEHARAYPRDGTAQQHMQSARDLAASMRQVLVAAHRGLQVMHGNLSSAGPLHAEVQHTLDELERLRYHQQTQLEVVERELKELEGAR